MAGKFKLFGNYSAEGKGVSKTEKLKKKNFVLLFELYFRNFGKLFTAGIFYTLFTLPLLTNGLADAGLTNITRNIYCGKHSFGFSDFMETIKKNWKQALPIGIIRLLVGVILGLATYYYATTKGDLAAIGLGVCIFGIFCFVCMQSYLFLITISFGMSVKKIIVNSFKFVFLNLWKNILLIIIDAVVVLLGIFVILFGDGHAIALTFYILFLVCFYPSFRSLAAQFCAFPSVKKYMIDPYYEEHPDADIELRRSMGLLNSDENEHVFEDDV